MNVVDMPIAELAPAPYNPRKDLRPGDREYESLKRSILEFGLVDPVIFNTRTKRVVGGHQRLTVLRDLGRTSAPAVLVDLDEPREKALNLALNKITGAWDMPLLKDLLLDIEHSGGDQTLTGFDPKEIEEILTTYRDDDPGEDLPVPEPPADPVTRAGDLYELGPHRLVCGDSRDGATWERLMGKELAHCMWTDPPYGIDLQVRDSSRSAFHGKRGRDWTTGTDAFKGDKLADLAPAVEAGSRNAVLPAGLRDVAADFLSVPQDRQAVRRGSRELSFGHLDSLLFFGAQYHRPLSVLELDERRVRDWAVVRGVYLGLPFTPARMTRSLANSPWFGNSSKPDETSRAGTLNSGRHAYR